VRCAQLAIDQFNAAGGLKGRMATLLVRDDKLNPGEAATRTLELIEKDKVHCIVGALSSSVQLSVNEITKRRGVLYNSISQSDTINEAKDFSKYTFHEALNPHMTATAVGRHVFSKYGKRAAYLVADYAFGHEMLRGFQVAAKELGVQELIEIRHPLGAQDYSSFFPRILEAKPDVLCILNFGRDQLNSFKQAANFGLKSKMRIAAPVLSSTQRLAGGSEPYADVIGAANYYWDLEKSVPSAKVFNDAYRAKYNGELPSDYGSYGYVAVRAFLEGMKKAGSTDTDAVINALESLKYDLYKGSQYYRKCDHQSVQDVLIVRSKKESEMKGKDDIFEIVGTSVAGEDKLRTCQELGHKA
jgi:branched-chain amino acid transport system substrate-binding protein